MMGPYRNHPAVLVRAIISYSVLALVLWLAYPYLALIPLVLFFISFRIWYRTMYLFTEDGIERRKNTMFKDEKNIPYQRISSLNEVRTIIDRIIGTVTLSFNINSGVNAAVPEVSLVLRKDQAFELRAFVESRLGRETVEVPEIRDVIKFGDLDAILHGTLSMPTASIVVSMVFLAYSVFDLTHGSGVTGMISALVFISTLIMPIISQMLRYADFSVYRSGNTLFLEHGLFQKYRSSFDISRINAVRIKSPLLARMLGRSSIEAEVVGINASAKDATPVLCLMTSNSRNSEIFRRLLPEFVPDYEIVKQPDSAVRPLIARASAVIICTAAICVAVIAAIAANGSRVSAAYGDAAVSASISAAVAVTVIISLLALYSCRVSMRSEGYHFGEDSFTFVRGVVDRNLTIIEYDRAQISSAMSGPVSRHYGLCRCRVSFLSSVGNRAASSCLMDETTAASVSDTLMARIRDGRYVALSSDTGPGRP